MRILVIGGTGFVGTQVIQQLQKLGHTMLVIHRNPTQEEPSSEVQHLLTDRACLPEFRQFFQQFAPEVVLDMIPYTELDARIVMETFHGIAQRLVVKLNTNQDLFFDTTRIRQELGYREPVSLDEALKHTIAWQRANPPADIDPHLFDYTLEDVVLAKLQKKSETTS